MKTKGSAQGCPLEFPPYTWFLTSAQRGKSKKARRRSCVSRQTNQLSSSLLAALTILLAADAVAQAGADHVLAALLSEPALSLTIDGSSVCAACPYSSDFAMLQRLRGGHHDSPRVCSQE